MPHPEVIHKSAISYADEYTEGNRDSEEWLKAYDYFLNLVYGEVNA